MITYQGENWAKIMLSFFKRIDYGFYLEEEIDVHLYHQSDSAYRSDNFVSTNSLDVVFELQPN